MNTFPNNPAAYDLWQLAKFGDVIAATKPTELENGTDRREYEENQINNHFENELYERQSS